MTAPVAGIDPHQANFIVGIVDEHGIELNHETFDNTGPGFTEAIDLLTTYGVERVGVEGSASWGAHIAIALAAAGFDGREVPAQQRPATLTPPRQDRHRRRCLGSPSPAGRTNAGTSPSTGRL